VIGPLKKPIKIGLGIVYYLGMLLFFAIISVWFYNEVHRQYYVLNNKIGTLFITAIVNYFAVAGFQTYLAFELSDKNRYVNVEFQLAIILGVMAAISVPIVWIYIDNNHQWAMLFMAFMAISWGLILQPLLRAMEKDND